MKEKKLFELQKLKLDSLLNVYNNTKEKETSR